MASEAMKSHANFDVLEFYRAQERVLQAKLDAVRAVIQHPGEKGRMLESVVRDFLRSLLPDEYGISTGFIVSELNGQITSSPQLDIIIYDAVRGGPIARLESCDVFPLESVIAYFEVKTSLRISSNDETIDKASSNSVLTCLDMNRRIREMRNRDYYRLVQVRNETTGELNLATGHSSLTMIAIRAYAFAFDLENRNIEAKDKNICDLAHSLMYHSRQFTKDSRDAHIHGIFVPGQGYVRTLAHADTQTEYTTEQPLSAFKWSLLQGLATVKRIPLNWTPNIERYAGVTSTWRTPH